MNGKPVFKNISITLVCGARSMTLTAYPRFNLLSPLPLPPYAHRQGLCASRRMHENRPSTRLSPQALNHAPVVIEPKGARRSPLHETNQGQAYSSPRCLLDRTGRDSAHITCRGPCHAVRPIRPNEIHPRRARNSATHEPCVSCALQFARISWHFSRRKRARLQRTGHRRFLDARGASRRLLRAPTFFEHTAPVRRR